MHYTIIHNKSFSRHAKSYLRISSIPLALSLIFVLQTLAFNFYFHISPDLFVFRLIVVSFSLGVALYGPAMLFNKRGRLIYLSIISCLISFVFIAQFLYFSYSGAFLQVSAIAYAGQATALTGTIKTLLSLKLLVFVINIALLILVYVNRFKKNYKEIILSRKEKIVAILLVALIVISGYSFAIAMEKHQCGSARQLYVDIYDLNAFMGKLGIINFTIEDAIKYSLRVNQITDKDIAFAKKWDESRKESTSTGRYFGIGKNRNVIMVQIESLENAVINQKINGQEITPNLNRLAQEGLYFNNFYAQIGPGNTADTEFVVNNSLYPLPDDVAFVNYAHNKYQALPQFLIDNGYHTSAFHGDVPTFWNRSNIYPELGYQNWFSRKDYIETRVVGVGFAELGDEDFFIQTINKLKELTQPFLATLITLSSHTPFELPADLKTLSIPAETSLNYTQQQYLQSIHYTDQALGKFVEQLRQTELYKNSIIIIYGDHQSYTDISIALQSDEKCLPELRADQIPLIIIAPDLNLKGTINTPSSQIDLYPTITNLLGIKPPQSILGQDILNNSDPIITHRNAITGTINTILGSNIAYEANQDGIYENGKCLSIPDWKILPIDGCLDLYNQQRDAVKASDIIIKGNLIDDLK